MATWQLLDLYCGAGGSAYGYMLAGFHVTGVDISPQPRYRGDVFIQGDALEYVAGHGHKYDVIHASPPCQKFTQMNARWRGKGGKVDTHRDWLSPTRQSLQALSVIYVIENVIGARKVMTATCLLHGGMFQLSVYRPRLFECNVCLFTNPAPIPRPCIGVYGDHPQRFTSTRKNGAGNGRSIFLRAHTLQEAQDVMGIPWMNWQEIREAIPPAYTKHIGCQLIQALQQKAIPKVY